ncbi:MAG: metalloregulator ArsR/SmtB family transcription factor [Limnochordia bacterium]|jgi:DNA-binding transcriptional ArsR family regulator|nr:metalloregulator ArsR/SmtB family transcription factor [Limnochordia bacterium]MDD2630365.1 metalloregulator ArsR/SmtB family transcription factor [Limnochordia bacterium]MDD4517682.1 metalloregulator ArsR/SmtB family transcription factor [Limnochordia bacterium]
MQEKDVCDSLHLHQDILQKMQGEVLSDELAIKLAETFKILGDPTRVRIIHALFQRPLCVCHIANLLGISQSAASHQLRSLRNMRIVKYYRDGKNVIYSLDDEHIVGLFREGLEHIMHN